MRATIQEMDTFVKDFQIEFKRRFLLKAEVTYSTFDKTEYLTLDELKLICDVYLIEVHGFREGVFAKRRHKEIVATKHVFFYLAHEMKCGCSMLGRFSGFDHATVLHAIKRVTDGINFKDDLIKETIVDIRARIANFMEKKKKAIGEKQLINN